eukprot:9117-Heterococcus_DN1.PRE.1
MPRTPARKPRQIYDKCYCLTGTLGQLPKQQSVDVLNIVMAATKGPGELPVVQHRLYIEKTSKGD